MFDSVRHLAPKLRPLIVSVSLGSLISTTIPPSAAGVPLVQETALQEGLALRQERLHKIARDWSEAHLHSKTGAVVQPYGYGEGQGLTRETSYYAYSLLLTQNANDFKRAESLLGQVLDMQDLTPDSSRFGAFPVVMEKPNNRWDHNFTIFVGSALAMVIDLDRQQGNRLSSGLRERLEKAVRHATDAAIKRDVDARYSNIALLSTALAIQTDHLFSVSKARDFAERKLNEVMAEIPEYTPSEYRSPTYYGVDLMSLYIAKKYAPSVLQPKLKTLLDDLWLDIARSYHSPTHQMGGPLSRAYENDMLRYANALKYFLYLAAVPDYPIPDYQETHGWDAGVASLFSSLPIEVRPEFAAQNRAEPLAWREFSVKPHHLGETTLRQYRKGDFILGTASDENFQSTRRPLLAFWPEKNISDDGVVYAMDDSGAINTRRRQPYFVSVQHESAVLSAISDKGAILGPKHGWRFLFSHEAKLTPLSPPEGGSGWIATLGSVKVYLFPVTQPSTKADWQTSLADGQTRLERYWGNAEESEVGFRTLAHLVVFRLPGEEAPKVEQLSLQATSGGWLATAKVNGTLLKLPVRDFNSWGY